MQANRLTKVTQVMQSKCARFRNACRPAPALAMVAAIVSVAGILPLAADAAEVPVNRWGLGFEGGVMKLQEGGWDYSAPDHFGRVRLGRGLSRHWSLHAAWMQGNVRPGVDARGQSAGWSFNTRLSTRTLIRQPMLELEHRLSPGAVFSPTLTVGVGVTDWRVIEPEADSGDWLPQGPAVDGYDLDGEPVELSATNLTLGFGVGLDITLTNSLHLGLGGRYQILQGNDRDNVGLSALWGSEHVDANTALSSAWAGLTWWLGSADADGDGVPDKRDGCPTEAEDRDGFNDLDGCPDLDNDGDGTPDGSDQCPRLAEDRDGWLDDDGCPDLDNDGDGIPDGRDRCPDQAEDIDGDADADGCPDLDREADADGDGVPDARDRCPGTESDSLVDAEGCPVLVPASPDRAVHQIERAADFVLDGVAFASGSSVLTADARLQLEEVAAWLAGEPGPVEIRGHTDASGEAEANRDLSVRRAESVRQALIQLGLPAARLTAVGYGEEAPIADNGTPEGRASNRRVEVRRVR
jgi:outer membrane protein OmpA-like peptidoglycan-associated protein/opacity protein-like surface antigen